ncbi:hypothetical protein IQ07DRAFT_238347 [Pyrenochaeta sp. DS3sAY3a]|nr:hypothetical protein IQ07DRAFT_238347 [Pyrenochaeta sp. DS3sAY3a]
MTTVFDNVRNYAQHHPLSVAAGVIIVLPGTYFYITERTNLLNLGRLRSSTRAFPSPEFTSDHSANRVQNSLQHLSPTSASSLSRNPFSTVAHKAIESTRKGRNFIGVGAERQFGNSSSHWLSDFPFTRILLVALIAALPGFFLFVARQFPASWASRHQTKLVAVLHFIALASFAHQKLETSGLLLAALVMVAFDVFQRALGPEAAGTTEKDESEHQPQTRSAVETLLAQSHSVLGQSGFAHCPKEQIVESGGLGPSSTAQSGADDTKLTPTDSKDREIVRLQHVLTKLRTTDRAKEVQLRVVRDELQNARDALNETFAEYSNLREELKTVKQTLGRDHQAIIYRKDIELFALRKGNEQKEKYIKEREAKQDEMYRQQKSTIEVKDAQLKLLKDRLASVERTASPKFGFDTKSDEDGDHALEVRLLRVRKGKNSVTPEEEKDAMIAKLQDDLVAANKTAEAVVNQQAELQRAWEIAKKIQSALREEKEQHVQTREKLQEAVVKIAEHEGQWKNRASVNGRLPTIDEDEHDTKELGRMFDAAQEDNLRLYAEVEALERRLRDANSRMFTAVQEADSLREQVKLERKISEDMELVSPSVVHRAHFQRMEAQLKESRDALMAKEEEIELLRNTIAEKDHYVKDLQGEVDAAVNFHTQDQDEIERLKQSIVELQATKEQLMLDHERLASQRTRQRVVSTDRTSARSSDERSPMEAMPPMPALVESRSDESIQQTPTRHVRSKSSPVRRSLISQEVPPPELRELKSVKRRSLGFKDLMKKIVRKDSAFDSAHDRETRLQDEDNSERPKTRNSVINEGKRTLFRPKTANTASESARPVTPDAMHKSTVSTIPENLKPPTSRRNTPRYYAAENAKEEDRPKTAIGDDAARPSSRRSWAATNKLKRRSLY